MIKKYASPVPGHVRVVFELPSCLWADRIFLSGDFNNWGVEDIRLQQDRNGVWRTVLDLPVGRRYEFRYVIDGEWRTDFHADDQTDNNFGSHNSVVVAALEEADQNTRRQSSQVNERQIGLTRTLETARRRHARLGVLQQTP